MSKHGKLKYNDDNRHSDMFKLKNPQNANAGRLSEKVKKFDDRPAGRTSVAAGCKSSSTNSR